MLSQQKAKHPKPAGRLVPEQQKEVRLTVALAGAATFFILSAIGAGARTDLLRGHVSINERRTESARKVQAPKTTSDLAARYGSAASSPAIAGAIKKAEKAPDARMVSETQAALAHGIWKPGADPMLAIMYNNVPPNMSQQQAAILYRALPHLPRMPESIIAENADRYAGVPDLNAGLPQGVSGDDIQAANERMFAGDMRERFGPTYVPPLHNGHAGPNVHVAAAQHLVSDHQISLIRPQLVYDPAAGPRSVREMTNSSGVVQSQFSYDPYGRETQIAGTGATPDFGYEGYYLHQPSGLSLTRTRAYSPTLGRFLNRDILAEDALPNRYVYALNSPTNFADPSGLFGIGFFGGGTGAIGVPGAGAAGTGGVGAGLFGPGLTPGAFASGGSFSGVGTNTTSSVKCGCKNPWAAGLYGGFGGGGFLTNANYLGDITGPFTTSSIGLPFIEIQISTGTSPVTGQPIWLGSGTIGPAAILYGGSWCTNTSATK